MDEKEKQLREQLKIYEKQLDLEYINYAKLIENTTSLQMRKIDRLVDKIITIKKEIKERGSKNND